MSTRRTGFVTPRSLRLKRIGRAYLVALVFVVGVRPAAAQIPGNIDYVALRGTLAVDFGKGLNSDAAKTSSKVPGLVRPFLLR